MYLLFAGPVYFPGGGFADFRGSFEFLNAASLAGAAYVGGATPSSHRWYHVVSVDSWEIVDRGDSLEPAR